MKLLKYLCILGWGWLVLEAWLSIDQPADCHCCDFDSCCGWELATFALTALYFFWSGVRGRGFCGRWGRWLCGVFWGFAVLSHAASCILKFNGTWLDNRIDSGTVMAWTLVLAFVVTGLWGLGCAARVSGRWRWARRLALGGGMCLWVLMAFSNGRYQFYAYGWLSPCEDWVVLETIATLLLLGVGILLSVSWRRLVAVLFAFVHFFCVSVKKQKRLEVEMSKQKICLVVAVLALGLIAVLGLVVAGTAAPPVGGDSVWFLKRHAMALVAGLALAVLAAQVSWRFWLRAAMPLFVLWGAVFVASAVCYPLDGRCRYLPIGPLRIDLWTLAWPAVGLLLAWVRTKISFGSRWLLAVGALAIMCTTTVIKMLENPNWTARA